MQIHSSTSLHSAFLLSRNVKVSVGVKATRLSEGICWFKLIGNLTLLYVTRNKKKGKFNEHP